MTASTASEIAFLARALKAPRIPPAAKSFANKAADEGWDHAQFLAAVLAEEVAARETHGGQARIKAARFPQVKTVDDFDFGFQRSVKPAQIAHLAQLDFLHEASNVVFLGPPGTGKTHLSIALGVAAARRGHRVAFATAHEWVNRLAAANRAGRLDLELQRLRRVPLVIIDEVGYIPFDPDAAALFLALISSRYERASLIVNSNKTFSAWAGDLRRRRRRRGHGRPARAPRRGPGPQGRQLPAALRQRRSPRHQAHPLRPLKLLSFRRPIPAQLWMPVDTAARVRELRCRYPRRRGKDW